ncbi:MAG: ribbon-helix-helix protein, CopG family [Methylohalobius sp. ZOD2]
MRINARLDDSHTRKLEVLQQETGKTKSEILKEALDLYFQEVHREKQHTVREKNRKILEALAGIGQGPEDLSENYKEYLSQGLKQKHDPE